MENEKKNRRGLKITLIVAGIILGLLLIASGIMLLMAKLFPPQG